MSDAAVRTEGLTKRFGGVVALDHLDLEVARGEVLGSEQFLGGRLPLRADLAEEAFQQLPTLLSLTQRIDYAWRVGLNNVAEGILDLTTGAS